MLALPKTVDVPKFRAIPCLLLFCISFLAVVLVVLELGIVTRTQTAHGPFPTSIGMLGVPVQSASKLSARSDGPGSEFQSDLKLSVNGIAYQYPHSLHQKIRDGLAGAYNHWEDWVYFSLPAGVANSPDVTVTLVYPLQLPSAWMTYGLLVVLTCAAAWIIRNNFSPQLAAGVLSLPTHFFSWFVWVLAGGTVAYIAITFWAFADHWALPTTAPIRLFPLVRTLAFAEERFPKFLLAIVIACCASRWLAIVLKVDVKSIENAEARLSRQLGWFGLPILIALCIFSMSAVWAGLHRPGDVQYMSIQGLVPFSDARDYFDDANRVIQQGVFTNDGQNRPIAEAMRTAEYALSGLSYVGTLLIQAILFAVVTFWASTAVARRFGVWPAVAFAAMVYAVGREFLPTFLTESIGLLWGVAAVPFFIACVASRSLTSAIIGIFLFAIGMFARMGAMFTLPAMVFWTGIQSFPSFWDRLRTVGLAFFALVLAAMYSYGVAKVYTRANVSFASNFSYTACGLSVGGDWTSCPKLYEKEFAVAKNRTSFLYAKALANLRADSHPALKLLGENTQAFVSQLPGILTEGYIPINGASFAVVWLVFSTFGFAWLIVRQKMSRAEFSFWLLVGLSTVASAAVIFQDDGRRVMIVSYPLAALFFSRCLCPGPKNPYAAVPLASRPGLVTAVTSFVLLGVAAAPYAMHMLGAPYFPQPKSADNLVVFGGSRMTGTLVVADDKPLPKEVAAIHISDFVDIIRHTAVEDGQGLVTPTPPPLPFAFVAAPEANLLSYNRSDLFVAPPEVLTKPQVPFWRLHITDFRLPKGNTPQWYLVTKAEAVPSP
jgi:hypothetical protein